MLEREIENELRKQVKKLGGLCFKFTSPGAAGVPDRIIITPQGKVWFVELKAEKGQLTKLQDYWLRELRIRGANTWVVYGMDGVREFVSEVMKNEMDKF